jgi:hypothetical protein
VGVCVVDSWKPPAAESEAMTTADLGGCICLSLAYIVLGVGSFALHYWITKGKP